MNKARILIASAALLFLAVPAASFADSQSIVDATPTPTDSLDVLATDTPTDTPLATDTPAALPVTGGNSSEIILALVAVAGLAGALYFLLPSRNE